MCTDMPVRSLAVAIASCLAIACGGGELSIESPADGTLLTTSSDTAPALAGVQVRVIVGSTGLAAGTRVDLRIDGSVVATLAVPEDGRLVYDDVTFAGGEHTIDAIAPGVQSAAITVTVIAECFAVAFESPRASGDALVLGPEADTDGEACGATFETGFEISTDAADGSEARVYVDGAPRRTAIVSAGRARFDGVPFDRRGDAGDVRADVMNGATGQVCGASYPVPITIDCEGVSCAIVAPDASDPFLGPSDDVSDAPGLQVDVEVGTDPEADGHPVRLVIDARESEALSTTASAAAARFTEIPLTEGVHRFRAHCEDARGNVTSSSAAEWTVDTLPCELYFVWPLDGEVLQSDAADLDPSTPEIEVPFSGGAGPDCAQIRVALCDAIDAASFEASSGDWSRVVVFPSDGAYAVCAHALDAAGNASSATTTLELTPPPPPP